MKIQQSLLIKKELSNHFSELGDIDLDYSEPGVIKILHSFSEIVSVEKTATFDNLEWFYSLKIFWYPTTMITTQIRQGENVVLEHKNIKSLERIYKIISVLRQKNDLYFKKAFDIIDKGE